MYWVIFLTKVKKKAPRIFFIKKNFYQKKKSTSRSFLHKIIYKAANCFNKTANFFNKIICRVFCIKKLLGLKSYNGIFYTNLPTININFFRGFNIAKIFFLKLKILQIFLLLKFFDIFDTANFLVISFDQNCIK